MSLSLSLSRSVTLPPLSLWRVTVCDRRSVTHVGCGAHLWLNSSSTFACSETRGISTRGISTCTRHGHHDHAHHSRQHHCGSSQRMHSGSFEPSSRIESILADLCLERPIARQSVLMPDHSSSSSSSSLSRSNLQATPQRQWSIVSTRRRGTTTTRTSNADVTVGAALRYVRGLLIAVRDFRVGVREYAKSPR